MTYQLFLVIAGFIGGASTMYLKDKITATDKGVHSERECPALADIMNDLNIIKRPKKISMAYKAYKEMEKVEEHFKNWLLFSGWNDKNGNLPPMQSYWVSTYILDANTMLDCLSRVDFYAYSFNPKFHTLTAPLKEYIQDKLRLLIIVRSDTATEKEREYAAYEIMYKKTLGHLKGIIHIKEKLKEIMLKR